MNLRASLKLNAGYSAELRSIGTGREIELDGGEAAVTEAVTLSVPGVMELQLSPADTDAAAVRAQLEEQRRRLRAVLEGYGASGVEELEDMAAEADAAARLAEAAEARLAMALDGEGLDEVERAAAQLPESSRSERDVDADILALCKGADIGRFMAAREAALERNKAEYGSAELLRGKLDGTEAELERLRAEAGRAEDVPAEYLDVADPARRMEELRAAAEAARDAQVKALREKSAAETRLEDFRAGIDGDPGEALKEAEADFGEQKRLLAHWRHIAQVFEERRAALSGSPMRGLAERFERNIAAISGGRNTAELPDGSRLDISVYSGDSEMSFGKLSEGTKETVSLAFRLAVLDHLFPEGGGFIVLDDPCADMDEGARRALLRPDQGLRRAASGDLPDLPRGVRRPAGRTPAAPGRVSLPRRRGAGTREVCAEYKKDKRPTGRADEKLPGRKAGAVLSLRVWDEIPAKRSGCLRRNTV